MMFWKKKNKKQKSEMPVKVLSALYIRVINIQTRAAHYLANKTQHWSRRRLKILLLIFCISFSTISSVIIVRAFMANRGSANMVKVDAIHTPKHWDKTGSENMLIKDRSILLENQHIALFQKYMDSLKIHDKIRYDSLVQQHAGLLDSIVMLEKILNTYKTK